jgi:hypothetical protein
VTTIDLGRLRLETEPLSLAAVPEVVDSLPPMLDGHTGVSTRMKRFRWSRPIGIGLVRSS